MATKITDLLALEAENKRLRTGLEATVCYLGLKQLQNIKPTSMPHDPETCPDARCLALRSPTPDTSPLWGILEAALSYVTTGRYLPIDQDTQLITLVQALTPSDRALIAEMAQGGQG